MRIFGLPWGYIQGRASQIEILNVCLQCSIPWVLPESLKPIEAHLLNGPVVCIGRAGPAKSDNCSGMCGVRSVGEGIPSVIIRAVINSESLFLARYPLDTSGASASMHPRKTDLRAR